jgi:hypothetical protein
MQSAKNHNQLSFALALLLLAVVACACPNTNDNRRVSNTNAANSQPNPSPTNTKPGLRLSRSELEQSFRQMLSHNFTCFNYFKTKWNRYDREYVLSGAPTGVTDACARDLDLISWTKEKKKADDWVAENTASLKAANVTYVNILYCTDRYGSDCHFLHAIAVK